MDRTGQRELTLYVAFHRYNRESLGDTVFVELGEFQSLLIQSHLKSFLVGEQLHFQLTVNFSWLYLIWRLAI